MPTITIFTGSPGPGVATAAAATALHLAGQGQRTLLLSTGEARGLAALLGAPVGHAPAEVAPSLDALALDGLAELAAAWERGRGRLPAGLSQLAGDELPPLPGLELAFGLLRLRELAPRYGAVVLDAGAHEPLLRALAAPDGLRWAVRLLFGLDRGPGRNAASLGRALLPTSFLPTEVLAGVQDARVQAEQLRELLTAPGAAAVHYVLRPDQPALAEARLAIPALQLHGLAVQAIVAGPLLPEALATSLAGLLEAQAALLGELRATWPSQPLRSFELTDGAGLARLGQLGAALAGEPLPAPVAPIAASWQGAPAVAIALPGLPKGALRLTLSGDELIVQVGAFRRHILLPEPLRGINAIKATREGEHLVVRKRI